MKDYRISDIEVGLRESFSTTITEEMVQNFYDITGDNNPLHMSEEYANEKGFKARVVYGMLTASLISTLGGCYIPGKYCLIQGVDIKFSKPVFIGDDIEVTGEVSKVCCDLNYLEVKVTMQNQYHDKVLKGLLKARVIDG